jgi:hypothetical protein
MQIKISLKQLYSFFVKTASDETLSDMIRGFAAKMTILTVHTGRIESKIDAEIAARKAYEAKTDGHIAELVNILGALKGGTPAAAEAPAATPDDFAAQVAAQGDDGDNIGKAPQSIEEEAEALQEKMLAETEAEAAALTQKLAAAAPVVTPIRKANGGVKAPAGGAA